MLELITKEDIELFSKIGINARFVSNKSKARFQWRNGNTFCDLNFENGNLSNENCKNNFSKERAKRIIERFVELDLTGITDIDGQENIIFRKGKIHYLHSLNRVTLSELQSKISTIKSIDSVGDNWYKLEVTN